eukprot:14028640-Alexandrium_andersonii.AAC.1
MQASGLQEPTTHARRASWSAPERPLARRHARVRPACAKAPERTWCRRHGRVRPAGVRGLNCARGARPAG